jgi:hypothetical protein
MNTKNTKGKGEGTGRMGGGGVNLTELGELREKLLEGQEFSQVFDFFMTHFGEKAEFHALGERTQNPLLEAIVGQVGKEVLGREVSTEGMVFTGLPEQGFIHGGGLLGGRLTTVIYFEDICVGLLAVVMATAPSLTQFARFTGRPLQTN